MNSKNQKPVFIARDIFQIRAFHSFYKANPELPSTERFVQAIVKSSDIVFNQVPKEFFEGWKTQFYKRRRKNEGL